MTGAAPRLDESLIDDAFPRYELGEWGARYRVLAGITARGEGCNFGLKTPDAADAVTARWQALFSHFAPAFSTYVLGLQVHQTTIATHTHPPAGWLVLEGVDGHATADRGVLLTVTVADCVPVYLVEPRSRTIALLHAGWRGVAAGMVEKGIHAVTQLSGASRSEIVMHCGVSICGECYEVGHEVHAAVGSGFAGRGPLDLRSVISKRARAAGVDAITMSGWCAAHDGARFFSHRRSGGRDGRTLAYLGVPGA
jgi:YfiH family protein